MRLPGALQDEMRLLPKATAASKFSALLVGQMYLCDLRSVRAKAADAGNLELLARTPACDISPDMLGLTGHAPSRSKHVVPRTQRKLSAELFTGKDQSKFTKRFVLITVNLHMQDESVVRQPSCVLWTAGTRSMHSELTSESIQSYLKFHRSFPDKHRLLIWQHLLHVPRNASAFQVIKPCTSHGHVNCRFAGRNENFQ